MSNKKKTFSGYPGDCSDQQLQVLSQFSTRARAMGCSNPPYDDAYFLRFLRARKFDLEKSMEMWTNYIKWRGERKVDEIRKMDFSKVNEAKQYYPHLWFRTDKLGRPIFIERLGKLNFDKLTKQVSMEELELHFIQDYERLLNDMMPACSKVRGEKVYNTCYIMDLKGVSAKMFTGKVWDLIKIASKIGQDYYPEILGHMFIINVPMFFYGMWNLIKVFVDEKTRNKIHIIGSGYKKELLKYIDEENLPDFLGGKVTAEEYGENFNHEQGPWVDALGGHSTREDNPMSSSNVGVEEEDEKPTIAHAKVNHRENNYDHCVRSVPVLINSHNSIGDHMDDDVEIGLESPLKQFVKDFPSKPSLSFNYVISANSFNDI